MAARRGESELALGNVIGSNLFNVLFILGASAALSPVSAVPESLADLALLLVLTGGTWLLCRLRPVLSRRAGAAGVGLYVLYTVFILLR